MISKSGCVPAIQKRETGSRRKDSKSKSNNTHPENLVSHVDELGIVAVELGLLHLNNHLVVLIVRLGASVFLVLVLGAAAVIEHSDLTRHESVTTKC